MFSYTPTAPGAYLIAVKYGGNYHIAGSPFKARIAGNDNSTYILSKCSCLLAVLCLNTHALSK